MFSVTTKFCYCWNKLSAAFHGEVLTVKWKQSKYSPKTNIGTRWAAKFQMWWATITVSSIGCHFDCTYPKKIKPCHCFCWCCTERAQGDKEWRTSQSLDVFGPQGSGGAAFAVCDKSGPCEPWEFPLGVLLLNKAGHTIAGESIIAHERMKEKKKGRGGRYARGPLNASEALLFLPFCLPLTVQAPFTLNGCLIRAVITLIWCRAISTVCQSSSPSSPFFTLPTFKWLVLLKLLQLKNTK